MSEARKTTYRPTDKAEKELTKLSKRFNYSTENGAINDVVENYLRVFEERDQWQQKAANAMATLETLREHYKSIAEHEVAIADIFFPPKPEPTKAKKK